MLIVLRYSTKENRLNENYRFSTSESRTASEVDEDLFQTARHITCSLYVNIILKDYLRTILDLQREQTSWSFYPRNRPKDSVFIKSIPEGNGNQISVEFNLLYRWHSTISQRDEQWMAAEFKNMSMEQNVSKITHHNLIAMLHQKDSGWNSQKTQNIFMGIDRDEEGTYHEDFLRDIFTSSVEEVAGSFWAIRVPDVLRPVEILGVLQSREWNVGTLNDFRHSVGLRRRTRFEDLNPDPQIVDSLSRLYSSPDHVELYPGLVVEQTNERGLCAGLTTGFAILSDALMLVRGDSQHTTAFNAGSLTGWG